MTKRIYPEILLYIFGLFLLFEWLRPIGQLTNTEYQIVFIIFIVIALTLLCLKVKWIIQLTINLLFILVSINLIYYDLYFFQLNWLQSFITDVMSNIGLFVSRNWDELSNEFRTFLFFLFLWVMVYTIHYYLFKRQRIFFFFFMTIVYITVLDTFTVYDAKSSIVQTVVSGFLVMGILTYYQINKKVKGTSKLLIIRNWMAPLAVMIAFSVLIGIAVPKAPPIWPDPVPFIQAANPVQNVDWGGGTNTIGYDSDDSKLGGSLIGNDDSVFQYESNGKHYWKMETKDIYTGKGWQSSESTSIPFQQIEQVPLDTFSDSVEIVQETARITILENYQYNFIMYPAGMNRVIDITPNDSRGNQFRIDAANERISFYNSHNRPVIPQDITVEFEQPTYKADELNQTTNLDSTTINNEFYQKYTQLPDNLPPRIQELAEQITAEETNWFDKAKAIEDYFDNPEFRYDLTDVAVPGLEDDYVDQFLFETQRGYCDNFSTSMTVMLRTLGIPARWVKGFTGGDFIQSSDQDPDKQIYEVTNNNAHSWVEVFFPNQGWVAFEPTKGYSNEPSIDYSTEETAVAMNQPTPAAPENENIQQDERENVEEAMSPDSSSDSTNDNNGNDSKPFFETNWQPMVIIQGIITLVAGILYRFRGKWLGYFILLLYRFRKKNDNFGSAFLTLLRQLERCGLVRRENQTLRNYAHDVDSFYSTGEMTYLTEMYEQYLYHSNQMEVKWEEVHQLWENLLKRTIH
jgi:transglutaminase-like putative cysteine protease